MKIPIEIVRLSIEQILQTMYFCESVFRGRMHVEGDSLGTTLDFSGSVNGQFRIAVSEALARQMASDFLAVDPPEISGDQVESMVQEFANVACGATLSSWLPAGRFDFSVPAPISIISGEYLSEYCFSISGERAELAVDIAFN